MKKKILGTITATMLVIMVLTTLVNAATLKTDKEKVEIEDIITVTVTLSQKVSSVQYDLTFDNTKYEYVPGSVNSGLGSTDANVNNGNTLTVSAFDTAKTTDTISVKFKALAKVENAKFTIANTEFVDKDSKPVEETFTSPSVNVTVTEKQEVPVDPIQPEDPTKPEKPTVPEEPTNPEEPSKPTENEENNNNGTTGNYIDENGNTITKLPQTGMNIVNVFMVVIIAAIAVITIAKIKKTNK